MYQNIFDEEDFAYTKKGNDVKSLAPLCIYKILEEQSSREYPLRINDLVSILNDYPYELGIERKAVGRHVANISDMFAEIRYVRGIGAWFEKKKRFEVA